MTSAPQRAGGLSSTAERKVVRILYTHVTGVLPPLLSVCLSTRSLPRQLVPAAAAPAQLEATAQKETPAEDANAPRRSLKGDALSVEYLLFLAFFSAHFFRGIFYIGTVDLQIASIMGSNFAPERATVRHLLMPRNPRL